MLAHYVYLNSAEYAAGDVEAQWRLFLRTELPSGLDRTRLALWDVRNLNIASNVRRVCAKHPGGRVLVIIGASHKPFLDELLAQSLDVTMVQFGSIVDAELNRSGEFSETASGSTAASDTGTVPDAASADDPENATSLRSTDRGLPRPADEWYLPTEDGRCQLFIREYGRGEPVVVLHGGWGAEHSYLVDAIAPHLEERRFVLYDQRGSLRSPAPIETISLDQHVDDLDLVRRTIGLDEMPIFAHSMGTFLAQSYLERHPDRVAELVLTAAVPPVVEGRPLEVLQADSVHLTERPEVEAVLAAEGVNGDDLSPREQTHAWRIRFAAVNLYHVDRWRQLQGGRIFYAGVAGQRAASTVPERWDFIDSLAGHPWNVTVILGDHDFIDWQAARWRAAAEELPEVELTVLAEAGHNAWIDQPLAFAKAVAAGLER